MKIIFDNKKEYDEFMEMCEYLHDYSVIINGISKKTKIDVVSKFGVYKKCSPKVERIKPIKGSRWVGFSLDLDNNPMLNLLAHLPSCDKKIQNKYLEIK